MLILGAWKVNFEDEGPDKQSIRVAAMLDIWNYIEEMRPVIPAQLSEKATCDLIQAFIYILHPAFNGLEIYKQSKLIFSTLLYPIPENFSILFLNCYSQYIKNKIK